MNIKIDQDFIIIRRVTRIPIQVPHSHLLIVEDDIWDPNCFWTDMDSFDTSVVVFVPNQEGVIPLLKVYQLYKQNSCYATQLIAFRYNISQDSDRFAITG